MHYQNLASQAKRAANRGEQSELYRIARELSGKVQGECNVGKDKDRKRITIEDRQLQRWAEHFREDLNRPDPAIRACVAQLLRDNPGYRLLPTNKKRDSESN